MEAETMNWRDMFEYLKREHCPSCKGDVK